MLGFYSVLSPQSYLMPYTVVAWREKRASLVFVVAVLVHNRHAPHEPAVYRRQPDTHDWQRAFGQAEDAVRKHDHRVFQVQMPDHRNVKILDHLFGFFLAV